MIRVNNGKGVFIRTGPASNIYEMMGAKHSAGCGYLVATAGTDTKVEVAFGKFLSGGVAVGGEVVTQPHLRGRGRHPVQRVKCSDICTYHLCNYSPNPRHPPQWGSPGW
jgi:hypothetical protein